MILIKLEDKLKLDIPVIDFQHETMIKQVNQIHEAMLQDAGNATLNELLSQLLESTRTHFSYEEKMMSQLNYPGFEAHKSEHNRLRQHLIDFVDRFKNDELLLSYVVVVELKEWATVHIEKFDKQLGEFLKNTSEVDVTPD